ncbi:MAG: Chloramphenicol acetyltransferase [Virgibacillus proomii]
MFCVINRELWKRKPYFDHFSQLRCTFSLTTNIDITQLLLLTRENKVKLYPALIYLTTKAVNAQKEFRTCFHNGELGYWENMHPSYSIFNKQEKQFSNLWTPFSDDFSEFYQSYKKDLDVYGKKIGMQLKGNQPPNSFPVSTIPWTTFTGFNLNINNEGDFLLPIITWGKHFSSEGNSVLIPISVQVHHAVL